MALLLAYDGTGYAGWQVQPGALTVQGLLQEALAPLVEGERLPVGASRTDAGVHALGQVATVDGIRAGLDARAVRAALNARLPPEVRALAARAVPPDLDARRSARLKRYGYLIARQPVLPPFLLRYAWHVPGRLDPAGLRGALATLRGRHDFSAFCAAPGREADPVCRVRAMHVRRRKSLVAIAISADRFLHHMVRNVVGSAVEVGRGARAVQWLPEVLASRDRTRAGPTAPARGLTLLRVMYGPGPG